MRPGQAAAGGEIVAVAVLPQDVAAPLRLEHLVRDAVALGVGDRLLAASAKRSRTWLFMSPEPVQPISGSMVRACAGTNSSTQSRVRAWPDCIALRAG